MMDGHISVNISNGQAPYHLQVSGSFQEQLPLVAVALISMT
ncbi:MAG: hypothetical protein R2795_05325 [Saprospiraceae bacterium]